MTRVTTAGLQQRLSLVEAVEYTGRSSGRATCLAKDEKTSESGGGGAELNK